MEWVKHTSGTATEEVGPSRARVLVVDDESVICAAVSEILTNAGFVCDVASTGADALARLENVNYDCLVSDVRMPGMDGIELAKKARRLDSDLEIILMTALVDTATAKAALKTDARDYLVKPFDVDELLHAVGVAIEHRRLVLENREYQEHLEQKVGQQAETIRRQFLSAIQSLAKAEEARDEYTRGHSERVADLAWHIACALGLSPHDCDLVKLAGLLHDIGKIGMPDTILLKKDKLTKEEWQIMQSHSVIGRDIIVQIEPPQTLVEGILHHHERWDGRGYPVGLSETAISLVGRILAVADAYDAMTSVRPYREAFTHEEAIRRLKEARGNQLDAKIVDLAVEIIVKQSADPESPVTSEEQAWG